MSDELTRAQLNELVLHLRGTRYSMPRALRSVGVSDVRTNYTALEDVHSMGLSRCEVCNRWGWHQEALCPECHLTRLITERDRLRAALADLRDAATMRGPEWEVSSAMTWALMEANELLKEANELLKEVKG